MKKTHSAALAAVFGLLTAGTAQAGEFTADVRVNGELKVPGCVVSYEGGSEIYNFGALPTSLIKPGTTINTLTDRAIAKDWTIACDGLTYLTYKVEDSESDSSSGTSKATMFGMGKVNESGLIGYYQVVMSDAWIATSVIPETRANVFATTNTSVSGADSVTLDSGKSMGWASRSANAMQAAETFKAKFTVTPTLAGTDTMGGTLTENIDLNGSLTFQFAFGL
jgi:hypothetical protein